MNEKIIPGYIATVLSITTTIPQIIHTYKTKKMADLSIFMIMLILCQCIAWVTFAIYDDFNQPLLICDVVVFFQYSYLLWAKVYYDKLLCFKKSTIEVIPTINV
jgi:uncharacterized protein with PQ loop repeat